MFPAPVSESAMRILERYHAKGLKIATAESCTAGGDNDCSVDSPHGASEWQVNVNAAAKNVKPRRRTIPLHASLKHGVEVACLTMRFPHTRFLGVAGAFGRRPTIGVMLEPILTAVRSPSTRHRRTAQRLPPTWRRASSVPAD